MLLQGSLKFELGCRHLAELGIVIAPLAEGKKFPGARTKKEILMNFRVSAFAVILNQLAWRRPSIGPALTISS